MGNDSPNPSQGGIAGAVAAIANSKAAEKLADTLGTVAQFPQNLLDYLVGEERIRQVARARAEGKLIDARAEAEIERLRAKTAQFVLDREMRKTLNREAIAVEARNALPPPRTPISDEPVSKDFVQAFFAQFDCISDPEVHKIAGRLLAGEVVRPGSFPRRTLRVLSDLESKDFQLFATLCRFACRVGHMVYPLVFELNAGKPYVDHGISFNPLKHLEALGLITVDALKYGYFARLGYTNVLYNNKSLAVRSSAPSAECKMNCGYAMFTEAGLLLGPLVETQEVPGFFEYVVNTWRGEGLIVEVQQDESRPATQL